MSRRTLKDIHAIDRVATAIGSDDIRKHEGVMYRIIRVRELGERCVIDYAKKTGFKTSFISGVEGGVADATLEYRLSLAMQLNLNMRQFHRLIAIIDDEIHNFKKNNVLSSLDAMDFVKDRDFIAELNIHS